MRESPDESARVPGQEVMRHGEIQRFALVRPIAASTAFVAAMLAVLLYFDVQDRLIALLAWLDAQGLWGPLIFVVVLSLVVVFLLPGVLFTTGAGFVFGVLAGSVYVVIGTTLGATAAFLLSRYALRQRAAKFLARYARLEFLNDALAAQGFRIVLLTRLVPFFPFKLSNYLFGLTRCSLRGFVAGTFLGVVPFSVHNVYLGAIAADLATLGQRHGGRTPVEWALYGAGFLIAIAVVVYLGRLARGALARYTADNATEDPQCRG